MTLQTMRTFLWKHVMSTNSKMELSIKVNGVEQLGTVAVCKCGLMARVMKVNGKIIRRMERVNSGTLTVTFSTESGKTTKPTVTVSTRT